MTTKETPEHQNVDGFNPKHAGSVDAIDDAVIDRIKQPTPPAIDVEALTFEIAENWFGTSTIDPNERAFIHFEHAVIFLIACGYLRAPLPKIDGLSDDLNIARFIGLDKKITPLSRILRAAHAYLKASEV